MYEVVVCVKIKAQDSATKRIKTEPLSDWLYSCPMRKDMVNHVLLIPHSF